MYPALLFSGLTISIAFVAMAFQWRTKKILPDCQLPQPETAHLTYESPLVIEKTGAAPKLVKKVPPIDINQLSISDNLLQLDTFSLTTAELPSETGLDSFTSPTPVPDTFLIVEKNAPASRRVQQILFFHFKNNQVSDSSQTKSHRRKSFC